MKYLITVLLLFGHLLILGQKMITGIVLDKKDRPLVGANIYVKGTYIGSSSDIEGKFQFSFQDTSSFIIVVTFIGYHKEEVPVLRDSSESLDISITLKEEFNKLNAVVVIAGQLNSNEEHSSEVMEPLDIVTTAGATADITGALNTLPGTSTVAEDGRLFVRGGNHDEVKTFIDGLLVLDPYQLSFPGSPVRNRFSPFMFSGTNFSTGGYSAEFGNALSSILDLNSKNNILSGRTDFSIMSVGLENTVSLKRKNSFLVNKVLYHDLTPYFKLQKGSDQFIKMPSTIGHNIFSGFKTKKGQLKLFSQITDTKIKVNHLDFPSNTQFVLDLKEKYRYVNLNYNHIINNKWSYFAGGSAGKKINNYEIGFRKLTAIQSLSHLKTTVYYDPTLKSSFKAGLEFVGDGYDSIKVQQWNNSSVFLEWNYYFSNKTVIRTGVRSMLYGSAVSTEPRVSITQRFGEFSNLSFGAGSFAQTEKDFTFLADPVSVSKSNQFLLNYQWKKNERLLRIEGYNKVYRNLSFLNGDQLKINGSGYARGFDLFFRDQKSIKNTDYWVSFSYIDSKRNIWFYPYYTVPGFVANYKLNIVLKTFIPFLKTQIGASTTLTAPRKFHNPNKTGFINDNTGIYKDFSVNFSYLARPSVIIHGSISNVFGFENVFGKEFRSFPNEDGIFDNQRITLRYKRFLFLGVFVTIAKNKTINQLPNL